jgi:TonB family protein
MKKIPFLLVLASALLYGSLVSADWIKEQQGLISDYESFVNLKESELAAPESNFKKGKYESEAEFNARVESYRNKNVRRFYFEYEAEFEVPNNSSSVNFPYSPFARHTISEDIDVRFGEGENAFGAKSPMMVTRGVRQVFQANEFDLQWTYPYRTLSIDKKYLQKNNADIVFIKVIDIDITDPDSFESLLDTKVARRDDLLSEQRFINETLVKGNLIAVGLYDKANKATVGFFSPKHDIFYRSYNGQLDNLIEKEKQSEKDKQSEDYLLIFEPQAFHPRRAQTRGIEGYAVIQVVITTTGGVRDPILIEEFPEGWGFGRAALRAASKLKYNPRVVDGVGQEVPGVLYKFNFQMAN